MLARDVAVDVLLQVIGQGKSLTAALTQNLPKLPKRERPLAQALVYGVLRYHVRLDWIAKQLLKKPFSKKDLDVHLVIEMGLFQIIQMRVPDHAAVNSAIEALNTKQKTWAKGVVNAVLRGFIRQKEDLLDKAMRKEPSAYSTPPWLIKQLKQDWPKNWRDVLDASNQAPPMSLRVNAQQNTVQAYMCALENAELEAFRPEGEGLDQTICLKKPTDVEKLPHFEEGAVSVQDLAPQLSAHLLAVQDQERVLDACAAPGGKTCHILESAPEAQVTAIDLDADRLQKVEENLQRLGLGAQVIKADVCELDSWWDGQLFDKVLLDAPCSATGVIRRHPDIKIHRSPQDIEALVHLQARCLDATWQVLKAGGVLLYATCSVLKVENEKQIQAFLERTPNAQLKPISLEAGIDVEFGRQLLPGNALNSDGFFYCALLKL